MIFHIITIFPEIFNSYFKESIIGRAQKEGKIKINIINLRNFTEDRHKSVDDSPYGGGAGMLMKVEPIYKAIQSIKKKNKKQRIILLSARGEKWNQHRVQSYIQKYEDFILICGRYEGVDERVLEFVDEEISIGDYILTGGEIPAMILVDSLTRLFPGVLGNKESIISESHVEEGILEYPQYTRPEIFKDNDKKEYGVPHILLSGNHQEIEKWRKKNRKKLIIK